MASINWIGLSGRTYECELFQLGTEFNPVSAVYIISKVVAALPGGAMQHTALYVGETESLVNRLNAGLVQHDGLKRSTKAGATHVGIFRVNGDAAERVRIETDLRHALNPPCNAQAVPVLSLADILAGR